jgi:hypothetical protein
MKRLFLCLMVINLWGCYNDSENNDNETKEFVNDKIISEKCMYENLTCIGLPKNQNNYSAFICMEEYSSGKDEFIFKIEDALNFSNIKVCETTDCTKEKIEFLSTKCY